MQYPLQLFIFDLLYADDEDLTGLSYVERREKLKEILGKGEILKESETQIVDTPDKLAKIFDDAITRGLEGIVAKDLIHHIRQEGEILIG